VSVPALVMDGGASTESMARLRIHNFSISSTAMVPVPQDAENPLGVRGLALHTWMHAPSDRRGLRDGC
jgi:hypothetical protein